MKHYSFFQNRECEYFPCHEGVADEDFNCLFCYCPLYALGGDCGGDFFYNDRGIKNCKNCIRPHERGGFEHVKAGFEKIAALAGQRPGSEKVASPAGKEYVIFFFSRRGMEAAENTGKELRKAGVTCSAYGPERIVSALPEADGIYGCVDLRAQVSRFFTKGRVLLFIGAAGIAVRYIAPFIVHKSVDPAVLVMDELCGNVIPILSGHLGGANEAAGVVAGITGARCVLTTATDINSLEAPDVYAARCGLVIGDPEQAKAGAAALLEGREVKYDISPFIPACHSDPGGAVSVWLIPPGVVLGAGCKKGTDPDDLISFMRRLLKEHSLSEKAVCAVASIDIKRDEPAVLALAKELSVPAMFYGADELRELSGSFSSSDFVERTVGCSNVCERAAVLAAGELEPGTPHEVYIKKTASKGMTLAAVVFSDMDNRKTR